MFCLGDLLNVPSWMALLLADSFNDLENNVLDDLKLEYMETNNLVLFYLNASCLLLEADHRLFA